VPDSELESSATEAKSEIKSRLYAKLRTRHMSWTNHRARTQNWHHIHAQDTPG
jgi:hypothetical protein